MRTSFLQWRIERKLWQTCMTQNCQINFKAWIFNKYILIFYIHTANKYTHIFLSENHYESIYTCMFIEPGLSIGFCFREYNWKIKCSFADSYKLNILFTGLKSLTLSLWFFSSKICQNSGSFHWKSCWDVYNLCACADKHKAE